MEQYFNPLSPHGERLDDLMPVLEDIVISIHSPRMGRDLPFQPGLFQRSISIHSPRMGRDTSFPRSRRKT